MMCYAVATCMKIIIEKSYEFLHQVLRAKIISKIVERRKKRSNKW